MLYFTNYGRIKAGKPLDVQESVSVDSEAPDVVFVFSMVKGVKAPISVRAGGSWGLPTLPPPSQILGNPDFGAAREILAKPIFTKVSMFRFVFLFLWEIYFFYFTV